MKLKIRVLLLLIIGVIIGCDSSKKSEIELTKGYAIVEGKVSNFGDASKVLSFSGETIAGEINQNAILNSLGNFRTEIELFNPQNVTLYYENGWANLYLKPNDSLFINIDANLFKQEKYPYYEITGTNPSTAKYIRDYYKFRSSYSFEPKYGDSVTVKEYLNDLEQQISVKDSVLNEFNKQHNPNDEFLHWAKKKNKYEVAANLLLYFWYFDVNRQELKPEIYDTKIFPVDDDSAIITGDDYLTHLTNYFETKYYMDQDSVIFKLFNEKGFFTSYSYLFDKLIKAEKPGLSKDIMIYKFILKTFNMIEISSEDRDAIWEKYKHYIKEQELVKILKEKKYRIENQDDDEVTTLEMNLNSKSGIIQKLWETISTKHKNKIIYIDIWATWCGPCRSEVPHAIELHNYFEGKPVAFVNLCMASKKDDWKKFIAQNHIKGDNYFFNEDETKLLREELKFHGYPTYMIMDQKGNLINKNAPRPSSGDEIKGVLNKLLEE